MNNDKIITMEKYGDIYKICIRNNYLDMYINGQYQGGIRVDRPNIYEWVIENIRNWLDYKSYLEKKYITEDLF